MKQALIIGCLVMSSLTAVSQDDKILELENVVITGSRLPQQSQETGRNITVLRSQVIKDLPVKSIDELLRYIPGIEAQSRNAFGAQSDFIIRGSTFQQVLILIDGMRLNDPLTGHFNSNIPITPAEIDRIEILRGPAASVYGADAVGGVVHIITRTFSDNKKNGLVANSSLMAGENGLLSGQAGGSYIKDKLGIGGGFFSNTADGHKLPSGERADFRIRTLSASGSYKLSENLELMGRGGYDFRDFNAQYFYTRSPFDKSHETTSNLWGQLKLRRDNGNSATDVDLAVKQTDDEFIFSPDFPSTNEHRTHYINFQINRFQQLNPAFDIAYGIQADSRAIKSTDRGDHEDAHLGTYGVLNYGSDRVNVNGSIRIDYDQNYHLEIVPQLNYSYLLGKWIFRGAAGRSIRAADYTERYISTNIPGPLTPGRNLGNPGLKAESAWSFEAGVDFYPSRGLKIVATGFLRSSSDLIDFVITNESAIKNNTTLDPGQDYFWSQNIKDVSTAGVELETWYQRRVADRSDIFFNMGYTYLNTSSQDGVVSKYIANHARHLLTSAAILTSGKWNFSLNGLFKVRGSDVAAAINSELKSSYYVINSKITYRVISGFGLNLEIHNLFDEQYSDILGAQMPGRWVMGGISWGMSRVD